ncbi:Ig-like domain-containing protein [Cellulomonas fimi]|uniref:Regulator of chromosome condensation RCC1 n=1 Tax=Cellulomonas fimi (strain ATCC 484 / DSM 20113 / JCM 1341 / CCUG 24087 / LMG 16345 / NBRC 15513 / NCIMB 8980 / NCTC 7547 / NRS-133) TaxID=590998 RepID=F4GY98_CELFA|nr:Ig-like domain-containing protein [Cellulomonas fimi]AEE45887.1 regulator of chromosome condensation RCC1 [Cellulomonas fimi ATCC 484]NNH06787.1 Ig-like domain repeat protein [Cellulomonas fimi]VEH30896.1 Uncharacterised protein [Cellulomonas fimi]
MSSTRRIAVVLSVTAALGLATAGSAAAAPKQPVPAPPAVAHVLPQVQLRVNPLPETPAPGDVTATITVKAPANTAVSGTYRLLDGGVVIASGTLASSGTGVVAVDLAPGTHRLTAVYDGAAKVNGAATKNVEVLVPVA